MVFFSTNTSMKTPAVLILTVPCPVAPVTTQTLVALNPELPRGAPSVPGAVENYTIFVHPVVDGTSLATYLCLYLSGSIRIKIYAHSNQIDWIGIPIGMQDVSSTHAKGHL